MTPDQVRSSRRWKTLRARLVREADVCAICGRLLQKDAPPRSRWYPSVDHITPLVADVDRAFDCTNLRVVHVFCNSRRAAGRFRQPRAQPKAVRRVVARADWR